MSKKEVSYDAAGGVSTPAAPGALKSKITPTGFPNSDGVIEKVKTKIVMYCTPCSVVTLLDTNKGTCPSCKEPIKETGFIEYA